MFETYCDARSVFGVRQILLLETGGRIAAPLRKQKNSCQIVSSAAHGKLKVKVWRASCECWLVADPSGDRHRVAFADRLFPVFLVPRVLANQLQLGEHGPARGSTAALPRTGDHIGARHRGRNADGEQPLDSAREHIPVVCRHVVYVCVFWLSRCAVSARARTRLAMGRGTAQKPENGGRACNGASNSGTCGRSGTAAFL